jgi:tRNA (uracil-5-)-methyltransferase TRM9
MKNLYDGQLLPFRIPRSPALIKIAQSHQPHSSIVADALDLPHPRASFDFVISIAVVHHLSTAARRIEAIRSMLELLHPVTSAPSDDDDDGRRGRRPGRLLLFVWALEQKSSRRGWDVGDEQDVMVPWVLKADHRTRNCSNRGGNDTSTDNDNINKHTAGVAAATATSPQARDKTYHRFYHLYRKGELETDAVTAGGTVLDSGYERDNWWAICSPRGSD